MLCHGHQSSNFEVFGANQLAPLGQPAVILPPNGTTELKVLAYVEGKVQISGSVNLTLGALDQVVLLFEIVRDGKVSVTNGPQVLISSTIPSQTEVNMAFSIADEVKGCREHSYVLILTNQSTTTAVPPVAISLNVDYFSMTIVGPSPPSLLSCDWLTPKGLQLWSNEIYTPIGIPALVLPPGTGETSQRVLNLPIVTCGGNARIHVSLAVVIPEVPIGSTFSTLLLADILRDGKSIFQGPQVFFRFNETGRTLDLPPRDLLFSLTLFDADLCHGEHLYQLVLTNQSILNGTPNALSVDTVDFNVAAPGFGKNTISAFQKLTPISVPALTIPGASSARFDIKVQPGAQTVSLNAFANFILSGSQWNIEYDFLRDGESIKGFQGPQVIYQVVLQHIPPVGSSFEINFRTAFVDRKVDPSIPHVYTFELINLTPPTTGNPNGDIVLDIYSFLALTSSLGETTSSTKSLPWGC